MSIKISSATLFRNLLTTATLVLGGLPLSAAPLSLSSVLSDSDQAPQVQKAQSVFDESSWKRVESYSGFLPTLSVGVTRLFEHQWMLLDFGNSTIAQIAPTTNYTLNLNWTLFDGLANVERWRSAKSFEQAASNEATWARFSTQRQLVLMYYRALAARTLREVAQQNAKALEDHLNDTKLFKRSGLSTNFDVLRVEVQLSEAQSAVADAQDNENVGVLRLGDVTNKDYTGSEVSGELPSLDPKLISTVPAQGDTDRKDLAALSQRVEGLDRVVGANRSHWLPRLSAAAQYQTYNNRGDQWSSSEEFRDARTIGVQLTWNLFDGFAPTARTGEAVEQRRQTEITLSQARAKARTDLDFWKRKYVYFSTFTKVRRDDVAKATESVRLAREGRRAGTRTNTDLLDAESELFRARAGLVNAQFGAIESLVNIELATGKSLYRFE